MTKSVRSDPERRMRDTSGRSSSDGLSSRYSGAIRIRTDGGSDIERRSSLTGFVAQEAIGRNRLCLGRAGIFVANTGTLMDHLVCCRSTCVRWHIKTVAGEQDMREREGEV